ncbi:MAG: peptide-methionine (S)-S-oxide reductase MsrA [Candidatus Moraniibacteriota bacterium]
MKHSFLILIGLILVSAAAYGLYWRDHRYAEPATITPATSGTATAYFAGGCFWCTEADFEKLPGVGEVISGFSGGTTTDPDYVSVSAHTTGHLESIEVRYDPNATSYETLVRFFFAHIDPTDPNGQFADQGDSYQSAVFYQSETERQTVVAEIKRLTDVQVYPKPIVTVVRPFEHFYPAEEYHQDYWKKNPVRYRYYRNGSGRDRYLEQACVWRQAKNLSCESTETEKNH